MKKLIPLLLITAFSYAQSSEKDRYISFAIGSDAKAIGKDYIGQVSLVSNDVDVNVSYEHYADVDYSKFAFGLGYHFRLYAYPGGREIRTTFIPSIEPSLINRWDNWGGGLGDRSQSSSHLSIAVNLSAQWRITDEIGVELTGNFLPRTDLKAMYGDTDHNPASYRLSAGGVPVVVTVYAKVVYKLDMN